MEAPSATVLDGQSMLAEITNQQADEDGGTALDLGNLLAESTMPLDGTDYGSRREQFLLDSATECTQRLVAALFKLPSDPAPNGVPGRLVTLPKPTEHLPREKPIPRPKAPTRWEEFAKMKGIVKRKKGRLVWDEREQEYRPAWGYKRANQGDAELAIEHREGDDPSIDPWTRMSVEKKERVIKNKKKQDKNLQAATGRRLPGTLDLAKIIQPQLGVKGQRAMNKRKHVDVTLATVQRSTASMGKFDKQRPDEPVRPRLHEKKRRDVEVQQDIKSEKKHNLALLTRIMGHTGDEVDYNKAVNRAQVAREATRRTNKSQRPPKKRKKA